MNADPQKLEAEFKQEQNFEISLNKASLAQSNGAALDAEFATLSSKVSSRREQLNQAAKPDACRHCGSTEGSWFSRIMPMGDFCCACGKPWTEFDGVDLDSRRDQPNEALLQRLLSYSLNEFTKPAIL